MKPTFDIYHLRRALFDHVLQPLASAIAIIAKPEAIFLLGASLQGRRTESIFNPCAPAAEYISDSFLLVLIDDTRGKELYEWQDIIENHVKHLLPVTTIVMRRAGFEEWRRKRHLFAATVQQCAEVLYHAGNMRFPESTAAPDIEILKAMGRAHEEGIKRAKEFLAGAGLFCLRKQYTLAAFMIHQSLEQALCRLIESGTGYRANTHNLERLLRYAALVSWQVPDIFAARAEKEMQLLRLLQKAYIDARYREDYKVTCQDTAILMDKAEQLIRIAAIAGKRAIEVHMQKKAVDIQRIYMEA